MILSISPRSSDGKLLPVVIRRRLLAISHLRHGKAKRRAVHEVREVD